jgi:hypothetical protein
MLVPGLDLTKIPKRYVPTVLVCLDQGTKDFGYVVLFEEGILKCGKKDRDLLIDAVEKFCEKLRSVDRETERLQ